MNVRVETNAAEVGRFMRRLFKDQEPFAKAKALNETALKAQARQRRHMQSIFTVRRKTFVGRAVKWKPRATKRRQWTQLQIEPPGGPARADILAKFETETRVVGGPRAGKPKPVPVDVKRTGTGVVTKRERLGEIQWTRVSDRLFVGSRGEKLILTGTNTGVVIFPQKGAEKGRGRLGYLLVPEVPIRPELNFRENIQAEVLRTFPEEYRKAWDFAIRTAR